MYNDYVPTNFKQMTIKSFNENEDGVIIGYMDLTDFECELGTALGGNTVYPSIEDVYNNKKCAIECGVVEVEVKLRRIVQEPKQDG